MALHYYRPLTVQPLLTITLLNLFSTDSNTTYAFSHRSDAVMSSIKFSAELVKRYLLSQKNSLTSGVDGLPQAFFKNCLLSFCPAINNLYKILSIGYYPQLMKKC